MATDGPPRAPKGLQARGRRLCRDMHALYRVRGARTDHPGGAVPDCGHVGKARGGDRRRPEHGAERARRAGNKPRVDRESGSSDLCMSGCGRHSGCPTWTRTPAHSAAAGPGASTPRRHRPALESELVVRRRPQLAKVAGGNVRRAFADDLRERYAGRGPEWTYYLRLADRIDAGHDVVVRGWAVRRWVRVEPWAYVRLELNGSVTVVEPVRAGVDINVLALGRSSE